MHTVRPVCNRLTALSGTRVTGPIRSTRFRQIPARRIIYAMTSLRLALLAVVLVAFPAAHAQKSRGRLLGLVLDVSTGAGVAQAVILHVSDGRTVSADSAGLFRFDSLPSGIVRFVVRARGFPSARLIVAMTAGEYMERRVELDSTAATALAAAIAEERVNAQQLAKVTVEAKASLGPRFANFERRRATGAGQYLTSDDIDRSQFSSLQDVARSLRGVTVECGGGLGCHIRMSRAPMRCSPEYVVDDNVDNIFGPTVPVRDIQALEVYTGPADVPGEYAGRNAGCGVIVIWTKSGPLKRKKS